MTYLRTQIFKGNDARRKADIKKIQIAVEEYEKDHDCYPPPEIMVCVPGTGLRPYLDIIPCDPILKTSYDYDYDNSSCPSWYVIFAKLENDKDSDIMANIGPIGADNYYASSPNAPTPTQTQGGGGATPTPPPGGGVTGFYGCKGGACVSISSQFECSPNYTVPNCNGPCGQANECQP